MSRPDPVNDMKLKLIDRPSRDRRILTVDQGDEQVPKRRIVTILNDPELYTPDNPRDVIHRLSVSTEELRNGCVKIMNVEKNVICKKCDGSGGRPGSALLNCKTCGGKGVTINWDLDKPIKFDRCRNCEDCCGMGKNHELACWTCFGMRVVRKHIALSVNVTKGMVGGQRIIFKGDGNEEPGRTPVPPGDAIVVLDEIQDE